MIEARGHQERAESSGAPDTGRRAAVAFDRCRSLARLPHRVQADFWLDLDEALLRVAEAEVLREGAFA